MLNNPEGVGSDTVPKTISSRRIEITAKRNEYVIGNSSGYRVESYIPILIINIYENAVI